MRQTTLTLASIKNRRRQTSQVINPQTITRIDTYSSVSQVTANGCLCQTNYNDDNGSGARFNFPLASMIPGKRYRCDFVIDYINTTYTENGNCESLFVDVCDDEPALGPYAVGAHSFEFTRPSYDTTYRFVDISVDEVQIEVAFKISGMHLTRLD